MKIFIWLLSAVFLLGCSESSGEKQTLSITKELPVINSPKGKSRALSAEFQKQLDLMTETSLVKVSELKIYQNKDSFKPLLSMLAKSQKYFYMNVLAFSCDEVTEEMVSLIEKKTKAGIDIRLIINKGYSYLAKSCLNRLEDAGVKIVKTKTHSSYFLNDQQDLMIGSQSVAWMFFQADGFNSLDRDLMLYSHGPLATDAYKDFLSIWAEESDEPIDLTHYQNLLKKEFTSNLRGPSLYDVNSLKGEKLCRFSAEHPKLGVRDNQKLWEELVKANETELIFSGVKVDIGESSLGKLIKEKSKKGMTTNFIGNGVLSGDGELTMELNKLIAKIEKGSLPFLAWPLSKINEWDKKRVYKENVNLYQALQTDSQVNVWTYFNFIHYKTWLFDYPGFFVGSANLDAGKFNVVNEAGVYCLDGQAHNELKAYFTRDMTNSTAFKAGEK